MARELISASGEVEILQAGPTESIVKVPGSATDDRLSAVEMRIEAGWSGPPPHIHHNVDHLWYVLDGLVQLRVGDTAATFEPGSCLYVPSGTPHSFGTPPEASAKMLQIDTPRPLDAYFRELATSFPPGQPVDPRLVGEIMRRHDTHPIS